MYRDCTIYVAKTKAVISFAVTAFVFAYAKCWFSNDAAHMSHKSLNILGSENL